MSPRRVINKMIGELLIERKIIDKGQLEIALNEQKERGGYISQHLISLGFAKETDIANCLASQYDFAYIPLYSYEVDPQLLKLIPFKLIDIYSLLPIDKMGNVLSVVFADPLNDGVIEMLKQITKCEIAVFISTYSEIREAINKYFSDKIVEESADKLDQEEILKESIIDSFVQVKSYGGLERRRFKRLEVELPLIYFIQGREFKATVKNISYRGIMFVTDLFIPIDKTIYANIICKVASEELSINSVVKILRVEKIFGSEKTDSRGRTTHQYEISGFFNFITEDDKKRLVSFLKERLQQNNKI